MTTEPQHVEYVRPKLYPKQEAAVFAPARIVIIEATTKCGKTVACLTAGAANHTSGPADTTSTATPTRGPAVARARRAGRSGRGGTRATSPSRR